MGLVRNSAASNRVAAFSCWGHRLPVWWSWRPGPSPSSPLAGQWQLARNQLDSFQAKFDILAAASWHLLISTLAVVIYHKHPEENLSLQDMRAGNIRPEPRKERIEPHASMFSQDAFDNGNGKLAACIACRTSRFARPWQVRLLQPARSFVIDQSIHVPTRHWMSNIVCISVHQYSCEQQSRVAVWKTSLHWFVEFT